MTDLFSPADALPTLCGDDSAVDRAMNEAFRADDSIDFTRIRSAFAIALHMHQPLIPAGGDDLRRAPAISNLQYMLEHPEVKDAHNARVFLECYKRMSEFIPQLLREGKRPRVMLDYSGCLLHGLRLMGANDVLDALRALTRDDEAGGCVEWLGTAWGHAVAPSTPPADFRLHVRAWQHDFAATFGVDALRRVRGFSPPEMALPNHPDVAYAFVKTLKHCGYRWVLVQEHTVESAEDGGAVKRPHVPHRLIVRNSGGQRIDIIAIIKTQGSDTKLVGQMQPYAEAMQLARSDLSGRSVPQLVTQISDGENGGVMMNEFPAAYCKAMRESSGTDTPAMNVSEYLDHLRRAGVREDDFPPVHPLFHKRIWDRIGASEPGAARMEQAITQLRGEDDRFHVEGGSWTSDISWVRGYEGVLDPMQSASARFAEAVARGDLSPADPRYRAALYHLLLSQTSCFRYWGEGEWSEYGRELSRRASAALG